MSQTKINTGYQDGVSVIADPKEARYIIDAPNDYDINYVFRGKNVDGSKFAEELQSPDKKRTMFAVPLDALADDKAMTNFNYKVREARTAFSRKEREKAAVIDYKDLLQTQMAIDKGVTDPTVVLQFGVPTEKAKDEQGNTIPDKKIPSRIGGEVLGYMKDQAGHLTNEQGTFFVLFGDVAKKDEIRFLRAIPAANLLGPGEFAKRDEVIAEKFPVGSMKYVEFDEKWKAKKIADYKPKNKEVAQDELSKAEERLKQLASPEAKAPTDDRAEKAEAQLAKKEQKPATKSKSKTATKAKEFDDIPF
ncbi:hypothetical protein LGN04_01985 [Burkholderia multivorans]|nr:hypothetical protein [Burkholderia multivorans]